MSSFEWMELQTLTGDINAARARLGQARSSKDQRLIRALEAEIGAAESRRDRLLSHISTHLAGTPEPAAAAPAASSGDLADGAPAEEESAAADGNGKGPPEAIAEAAAASAIPSSGTPGGVGNGEGGIVVWDQLTPSDLERAQSQIGARRAEMLARHAAELKTLEADRGQIDSLEEAVQAFLRRFNPAAVEAASQPAIVKLGQERELRAQARS